LIKLLTNGPLTSEKAFRNVLMSLLRKDFLEKREACASFISAMNDPVIQISSKFEEPDFSLRFVVLVARFLTYAPALIDKVL
jgi:hypothetical protein